MFEKLWGTNELLSSFDSINCLPPSSATGVPNDQTSWLHADQAPLRRGFYCIQVSCSTLLDAKDHGLLNDSGCIPPQTWAQASQEAAPRCLSDSGRYIARQDRGFWVQVFPGRAFAGSQGSLHDDHAYGGSNDALAGLRIS